MKKMYLLFSLLLLLPACSAQQEVSGNNVPEEMPEGLVSDACEFLTHANWEGRDGSCTNVISFGEDEGFSNWCACGSPVGDGDLVETFRYQASEQTLYLLGSEEELVEKGQIVYVDDYYLVVDLWDKCYVYENLDIEHSGVGSFVVGRDDISRPYLRILGYQDKKLSVAMQNYENDMAAEFAVWELPVSKNCVFESVCTKYTGGCDEEIHEKTLEKSDYEAIGADYCYGFLAFDAEGDVNKVIFYSEERVD